MADRIYIDTQLLEQLSAQIAQLKNSLTTVNGSVSSSLSEVRRVASSQTATINKLSNVQRNLGSTIEHANRLARATSSAANLWADAEQRIANQKLGESTEAPKGEGGGSSSSYDPQAVSDAIRKSLGYPQDTSKWSKEMWDKYNKTVQESTIYQTDDGRTVISSKDKRILIGAGVVQVFSTSTSFTEGKYSVTTYNADGSYSKDERTGKLDFLNQESDIFKKKKKDIPWIKDDGSTPERVATILQIGAERKIQGSLIHGEVSGENGWGKGSASYGVGNAEAHAELHAGLYVTKTGPDGKPVYVLEPGIQAKIGGSASLFNAEASGQIGSDNLNFNGKGSVTVGKVSADAEAQVGIVDGKAALHVNGSLEAIAAEAKGEVGVNIAGIEGKLKGSVNVGIGAHADVGYHDGKIVCDIGASLGIGGSISFELDVGGFVDNVADVTGKVVNGMADVGGKVIDGLADVGGKVFNGVSSFVGSWFS